MTDTTNRSKEIADLTEATDINKADLIILQDTSENETVQANVSFLIKSLVVGPYANDSLAATANVAVGELYYNSSGVVYVRRT